MPWSTLPNEFSRALQHQRKAGAALLDLTVSNPTQVFSGYPHSEIAEAYGRIRDFTYRPDPSGQTEARDAITNYYRSRGVPIAPERVVLTASTSEAYALLFKLLCDPGDAVLIPRPSYPLFEHLASLESVRIVPYRLRYDGRWFVDIADLRRQVSSRTKAIIVVNPNNPTGSFLQRGEAQELFAVATERKLPIISDEVFMDYALTPTRGRVQNLAGSESVPIFSLNGLSKSAGMPQMKLAWIILGGPAALCESARERLEFVSDTYLSVSTPVQCALPRLLSIGQGIQRLIRERAVQNLHTLHAILENSAAQCLHFEGGWSAIVRVPGRCSEDTWIMRLLKEQGVVVQPGYFFDMESEAYLVVSLITPPECFTEGIQRVRQIADS